MKAWLFQDYRQKQKLGDACPWSVGWLDPEGNRKIKRIGTQKAAERYAVKVELDVEAGRYVNATRATWETFCNEYESKVLAGMGPVNKSATQTAMNRFAKIAKPKRMAAITTRTIDGFVAARRAERCRGKPLSPATINRDLRYLRAVFRKATKWGHMAKCPEFTFLREVGRVPVYVTPEHFAALYKAADAATMPAARPFAPAEWWRGLLVVAYMTGWRIGSILALKRDDVDLDAGTALSRGENNKGRRDQLLPLHPLAVDHLRRLKSFSPLIFHWDRDKHDLYREFYAIQERAKVKPSHGKERYGFHDLRRAFATLNADRLTADALQSLMQHKSYTTTQRYINLARQANQTVEAIYVPDVTLAAASG